MARLRNTLHISQGELHVGRGVYVKSKTHMDISPHMHCTGKGNPYEMVAAKLCKDSRKVVCTGNTIYHPMWLNLKLAWDLKSFVMAPAT